MLASLTDPELAALTPDELEELLDLAEDIAGGESLREFICRISPQHPPPRHFDPIIDLIEAARAKPQKVCISLPPGHGKTVLFMHAIAWWLTKNPGDSSAYFSYNATQAHSKSVMARALAARAGVRLSEQTNNKGEWRTSDGGGLLAGGVGGGLTGQRVTGLLIVDDPFKGPIDAYSQTGRDAVDEWFKTVALTRREAASAFVIHTRWHEDDLIGRLAKRAGWKVINLPAIAEEGDPIGRAPGEALWPEMFPLTRADDSEKTPLDEIKDEIGEFLFAALYQGSPRPRGGSVFGEPTYYDPATTDLSGVRFFMAADPAGSEKTSADYSAVVVLAIKGHGKDAIAYVRHVYREQVTIPAFVKALVSIQQTYGNTAVNVESVGGFKAIPQMLKDLGLTRINEIVPVGDKFTRAQAVAAAWGVGRVMVPSDMPRWLGKFLDEVQKFTGVKNAHDDQVDALSHAWNVSIGKGKRLGDVAW